MCLAEKTKKRDGFDVNQQKSDLKASDGKAQCIQSFKATKTNTQTNDFKIHEAVQNVTPIKISRLKTQKQILRKKIQTYKSKHIINYLQISPSLI